MSAIRAKRQRTMHQMLQQQQQLTADYDDGATQWNDDQSNDGGYDGGESDGWGHESHYESAMGMTSMSPMMPQMVPECRNFRMWSAANGSAANGSAANGNAAADGR